MKATRTPPWRVGMFTLVLVALATMVSPFQIALVIGHSMEPALRAGDLLLVNKRAYANAAPHRGDIVLAHYQKDLIVKRVVGLPGEEVKVSFGQVYINGSVLMERYPVTPGILEIGSGKLLPEKYALVGDNRAITSAEGVHAVLAKDHLQGKVLCSWQVWPGW